MDSKSSGFTLIELLVVISIISLLSSIVFASLNAGRLKARDAAIKSEVEQMRILLEQNYSDYGSYTNLQQGNWFSSAANCTATTFAGTYKAQAIAICKNIVSNSSTNFYPGGGMLLMNTNSGYPDKYSIMAYLPYKAAFFCVGSSGANSDITTASEFAINGFTDPGCFADPILN